MSLLKTTRQYVFRKNGVDNMVIEEAKIPTLGDDEALVKIHAVSLQFADVLNAKGARGTMAGLTPCSDMAGEIIAIGKGVTTWSVGDRVTCNFSVYHLYGDPSPYTISGVLGYRIPGVLTEYRALPVQALVAIPGHLSYEEASTLPCAGVTAYNSLTGFRRVKAGDYVLIQGTGGVSIFGLQIALASGATVIVTSSSDKKLEIVKRLGAHHLINYKKTPDWDKEALRITGGVGVDHILEVGGPNTFAKSMNAVRMAGAVYVIGALARDGEPEGGTILEALRKAASIQGIQIGSVAQFKDFMKLLSSRPEQTRPVVDKVFPFERARDAYKYLGSQAHVGKVVIRVSKE